MKGFPGPDGISGPPEKPHNVVSLHTLSLASSITGETSHTNRNNLHMTAKGKPFNQVKHKGPRIVPLEALRENFYIRITRKPVPSVIRRMINIIMKFTSRFIMLIF